MCGFQPDESRQYRAFLLLPASIYPTALLWRGATTAPAMLEGRFLSGCKHITGLKVSPGVHEQQCKCVAQRPTWQIRTSSQCNVIRARLKRDCTAQSQFDKPHTAGLESVPLTSFRLLIMVNMYLLTVTFIGVFQLAFFH